MAIYDNNHGKCREMTESRQESVSRARVDSAGRVVIPAELRQRYGIEAGQEVILSGDDRGIHLLTFGQAVRAAQEAFAPYRKPGVSVVDELIAERREEAKREYGE
jgi:AbrB family looped-hinge helix DNA binding protein